ILGKVWEVEILCSEVTGSGVVLNELVGDIVHKFTGEATIEYRECMMSKPWEAVANKPACKVKEPVVAKVEVENLEVGETDGVYLRPKAGKPFAEIGVEANVPGKCPIPGTFEVRGTVAKGEARGSTLVIETGREELELALKPAFLCSTVTVKMEGTA